MWQEFVFIFLCGPPNVTYFFFFAKNKICYIGYGILDSVVTMVFKKEEEEEKGEDKKIKNN